MDINEFESRFMNENKDTVNKNALMFNKFVTKPITKEFLNRTFASLDLDDFFEVKKLSPRKSKYKAPEHLIKNLASSELYINKEIPEIAKKQCTNIPEPIPKAVSIPWALPLANDCRKIIAVSGPGDITANKCAIAAEKNIINQQSQVLFLIEF